MRTGPNVVDLEPMLAQFISNAAYNGRMLSRSQAIKRVKSEWPSLQAGGHVPSDMEPFESAFGFVAKQRAH